MKRADFHGIGADGAQEKRIEENISFSSIGVA